MLKRDTELMYTYEVSIFDNKCNVLPKEYEADVTCLNKCHVCMTYFLIKLERLGIMFVVAHCAVQLNKVTHGSSKNIQRMLFSCNSGRRGVFCVAPWGSLGETLRRCPDNSSLRPPSVPLEDASRLSLCGG